jgi:hypothetical protein
MKSIIHILLLVLIIVSCENPTSNTNNSKTIIFKTVGNSFSKTDSIHIIIENKSDTTLKIGKMCGEFLVMSYQKIENGVWSQYYSPRYMYLKCPVMLDSIKAHTSFYYTILPETFDSSGTFRLILNDAIFSNAFEIN